MNKEPLPLYRHIPTPEESYFYFVDWLSLEPVLPESKALFQLLGIEGVIEVRLLKTRRGHLIRALVKTESKKERTQETIRLDFIFQRPASFCRYDKIEPECSYDRRLKINIDPRFPGVRDRELTTQADELIEYRRFGAVGICPILMNLGNPAHRLYEGSIRWMAAESEIDPTKCAGESSIVFAKFINDHFDDLLRVAFGPSVGATAFVIDADTVKVNLHLAQRYDLDEYFDSTPMSVEVLGSFDICLAHPEIEFSLRLDYSWMMDEDPVPGERLKIKVKELREYMQGKLEGKPYFRPIDPLPIDEFTPFATSMMRPIDLSMEKGIERFEAYLFLMAQRTIETF